MIGYFPTPHEDETIFSMLARYKKNMGYENDAHVWSDFGFTKNDIRAIKNCTLPTNLASRIPVGWVDDLKIDENHTLDLIQTAFHKPSHLPFFTGRNRKLGVVNFGLYYCEQCAIEEADKFGSPYWHRLHQLRGVFVCHKHNCFLSKLETISASQLKLPEITNCGAALLVNGSDIQYKLLLRIAEDCEYLIANPVDHGRARLKNALQSACDSLRLNSRKTRSSLVLNELLHNTYSTELINAFELPNFRSNLSWIAMYSTQIFKLSPVAVLLGLYALGLTVDTLMSPAIRVNYSSEEIERATSGLPIIERVFDTPVKSPITAPDEVIRMVATRREGNNRKLHVSPVDQNALTHWEHRFDMAMSVLKDSNTKISANALSQALHMSANHLATLLKRYPHLKKKLEAETSKK